MADTYVTEAELDRIDFKKYHSICAAKSSEDGFVVHVFTWPRMPHNGMTNTDRLIVLVEDPDSQEIHQRIKGAVIPGR
ncbi:hypothetical protein [Pseudomonas typographi]|uniref:hypothetical protein n=1 Tax=Pseudomonas typographi TaxID=2715964 RepID=UPI00168A3F16|nr:hypothetical protein [Pseudomonas typographi]MBD1590292.1 hypothetical protein [Pseudomonas typographi]